MRAVLHISRQSKQRRLIHGLRIMLLMLPLVIGLPLTAVYAACTSPAGTEGQVIFNSDYSVLQYCDNTNWIAMTGGSIQGCYIGSGQVSYATGVIDATNLNGPSTIVLSPDGTKAYVTGQWNQKVAIYDISGVPGSAPSFLGVTSTIADLSDSANMVLHGNYLYATARAGTGGMVIVDVSNPASPSYVTTVHSSPTNQMTNIWGIDVSPDGNYAYTASWGSGASSNICYFHVIDVSTPSSPSIVGTLDVTTAGAGQYCNFIKVRNSVAYMTDAGGGILTVDVSNPAAPALMDYVWAPGSVANQAEGLAFSKDGHYIFSQANTNQNFTVWDVSDPNNLSYVTALNDTSFQGLRMWVEGDYAFTNGSNNNSMTVVDVSDPANPVIKDIFIDATNLAHVVEVVVRGRYAYLASNNNNELTVLDLGCDATYTGGGAAAGNGPQDCPNVGDLCDDGSIYAGIHPDMPDQYLFVAQQDQNNSRTWGPFAAINVQTNSDGQAVQNDVETNFDVTTFQSFNECTKINTSQFDGHTDWYLPAKNELNQLYFNSAAIDANASDPFNTGNYYSSSSFDGSSAWSQNFSTGAQSYVGQGTCCRAIRCIRRSSTSSCYSPYGEKGSVIYNADKGTPQFCNGSNWISMVGTGGKTVTFLTATGAGTWTVPSDWDSANNTIEVIGGGGGGSNGYNKENGGGGGAYSKVSNITLTPGSSVAYNIGTGGTGGASGSSAQAGTAGGDTWFCNSTSNCASIGGTAVVVGAVGGAGGPSSGASGGAGGAAASGVGTVLHSGGNGGGSPTTVYAGGGGGGAAGPNGDGGAGGSTANNHYGGGGGGGADGGSAGATSTTNDYGADGGNGPNGTGGGAGGTSGPGSSGSDGGGGGGGDGSTGTYHGGDGGNGTEWDAIHGAGGGGGGAAGLANDGSNYGGAGGLYGGGGAAGGGYSTTTAGPGGAGGQGIIVITYGENTTGTGTSGGLPCDSNVYQHLNSASYSDCGGSVLASTALGTVDGCETQCKNTWFGTYGAQCCQYNSGTCSYKDGTASLVFNATHYAIMYSSFSSYTSYHVVSTEGTGMYCVHILNSGSDYYSICGGEGVANQTCSTTAYPGKTLCVYGTAPNMVNIVDGGSTQTTYFGSSGNSNGITYAAYQGDGSGSGNTVDGGSCSGPCSSPSGYEGQIIYNADYHVMQYCNGGNWLAIGKNQ